MKLNFPGRGFRSPYMAVTCRTRSRLFDRDTRHCSVCLDCSTLCLVPRCSMAVDLVMAVWSTFSLSLQISSLCVSSLGQVKRNNMNESEEAHHNDDDASIWKDGNEREMTLLTDRYYLVMFLSVVVSWLFVRFLCIVDRTNRGEGESSLTLFIVSLMAECVLIFCRYISVIVTGVVQLLGQRQYFHLTHCQTRSLSSAIYPSNHRSRSTSSGWVSRLSLSVSVPGDHRC